MRESCAFSAKFFFENIFYAMSMSHPALSRKTSSQHPGRCGWRVFLTILFSWPCISLYSVGWAQEFPEPDPPKRDVGISEAPETPGVLFHGTPSVEWTFHKTEDGLHPDGNEQQFVWLMNRARGNPAQEGIWLAATGDPVVVDYINKFGVDLDLLREEFAGYSTKPPAAFDVRLFNAAQEHSLYLISIDGQSHDGQLERIDEAGFRFTSARGNVYSYTQSTIHGHAGFNIDWGYSEDGSGMQDGRGHRMAVMSIDGDYTNVGLAAVQENDSVTLVGPLVVSGNYCFADTAYPDHYNRFLVGTVWQDRDGDSMYDPGEGMGGVTVMPDHGLYYAVTGGSGGYSIPVLAAGDYVVTFSGGGVPERTTLSTSIGTESVLLDFVVRPTFKSMPWLHLLLRDRN